MCPAFVLPEVHLTFLGTRMRKEQLTAFRKVENAIEIVKTCSEKTLRDARCPKYVENPQLWSFTPTSNGDVHAIGHELQGEIEPRIRIVFPRR